MRCLPRYSHEPVSYTHLDVYKRQLMDEPLGAVDFQMSQLHQVQLENILGQKKTTALMVTHDVDESIYLSDRVIVMSRNHGKILEDVKIDLPRPRDRTTPEYHAYVDHLTEILKLSLIHIYPSAVFCVFKEGIPGYQLQDIRRGQRRGTAVNLTV